MTSLMVALAVAVAAAVPKDGKADEEFRAKVNTARDKAVKFLKEKQDKKGSWESAVPSLATFEGGITALVALSLLEAGVPADDPTITKAVKYLLTVELKRTYVVSLHTQVLARVDAKKYAKEIQANADWLMKKAITKGGTLQGWSYPANAIADNSNTHFAVMGLHAAAQAGAKVDAEIWKKIREYFADTQHENGGWVYHNFGDRRATQSMTTAGLLALAVAAKYDKKATGPDPAFEKGMKALFEGKLDDGKSPGYLLFTQAELGQTLGTTEFKIGKMTKSWYRDGAEELLKEQQEDGSFKFGEKKIIDAGQPVIATAFRLYFLGSGPAKK